jgi:hypothetical protein
MSYSIGGTLIADMEFTRAWGLSPASAALTCVGVPSVFVGGDAVLGLGATQFYGVLSEAVSTTDDGTKSRLSFVDNRIKLMWDDVYGLFNRVEVREDDPATPGIDRQKRYVHILPENWEKQIKTYTTSPYGAADIINKFLASATVRYGWGAQFDSIQQQPVHEVDALNGKKLGNVLQEISDAQGLLFTIVGPSTLVWARKGDGAVPTFDAAFTAERSSGEALSAVDTTITVVGDRNRYQEVQLNLEPDWLAYYESFWNEPQWMAEVAAVFGPSGDDFASRAQLAGKMRKVTLREYVTQKGSVALADYGMWGEVSRMEIPVWTYLHDIVFKAYRVPTSYTINGIPLDSLDLVEGLLAAVAYTLQGAMSYKTPAEYYPDAKGFAIVKGQPLDLLDPTKQRVISEAELQRASQEWSANNRFNLDTRNKTILFEGVVFDADALFVFPNKNVGDASDALRAIAVPNADVNVSAAPVQASLVFDAEKFKHVYGSGTRHGPHPVQGLSKHILLKNGAVQGEVAFADGTLAEEKAQDVAEGLIGRETNYLSGGFRRIGQWGTNLTGCIDRVTISLTFDQGITEKVDYTKERSQSNFEGERDLERKQKSKDLFPGQHTLSDDVKNLELIATVSKELKRSPLQPVYGSLAAVMEKPVGASDCNVNKIHTPDSWLAGQPILLGDDDKPSQNGKRFGGIVIADQMSGIVPCATTGIVPVRVQGPVGVHDPIGIDVGSGQVAKKDGLVPIGIANAAYSGKGIVLLPVRLGRNREKLYDFQMSDASDEAGPKVLIYDGDVVGPSDVDEHGGHTPQGMGNDDYVLPIPAGAGDYEIYLVIPVNGGSAGNDDDGKPFNPFDIVDPVTIAVQSDIPDNTDTLKYVRIGYASVTAASGGGAATISGVPRNTLTGDCHWTQYAGSKSC